MTGYRPVVLLLVLLAGLVVAGAEPPTTTKTAVTAKAIQPSAQMPDSLRTLVEDFRRLTAEVERLRDENTRLREELAQAHRQLRERPTNPGRFIDRGEYVEDTKTKLLWQKDGAAFGQLNYFDAFKYATGLTIGGRPGWRLPTRDEFAGIFPATEYPFENTQYNPRMVGQGPGPFPSYWTGDLDTRAADYAYIYQWYAKGGANNCFASRNRGWVRCVHDPFESPKK